MKTTPERGLSRVLALRAFAPVAILMVLALALRLWGITWGLPDQDRALSYHPDEGVNLVQGVLDKRSMRPHLDLNFYNYGGLYFYLWQGAVEVNHVYGIAKAPSPETPNSPSPDSLGALILVGRLLTVICGVLTSWAVFALGNRLFGRKVGLLAAFLWAIAPVAVVHGHYATVDVPATFFVTLALVYAAKVVESREPRAESRKEGTIPSPTLPLRPASECKEQENLAQGEGAPQRPSDPTTQRPNDPTARYLLLAGLFSGLAAATKYNCALVILAALAAALLTRRIGRPLPKWALPAVIAMAVLGFVVGCPGALINPSKFVEDFTFELKKSGEGMGLLFAQTGNGWWYHLSSSLRYGLGAPLLALVLGGVVLALVRRSRQDLLLMAFLLPYYLVIGFAQVRFLRYIIPLLPVLAVFAARFVFEPWGSEAARKTIRVATAMALAVTLLITLALDQMFVRPDTRDQAKAYIDSLPNGTSVAFVSTPWYYSPPLSPAFTAPSLETRNKAALAYADKRLLVPAAWTDWNNTVLGPPLPDAFAVSEFETGDARRVNWAPAKPFFDLWRSRYTPHIFEKTPSIFGFDLGKPEYTPNDWLYPNPRTTVYTLEPPPTILSNEPADRRLHQPPGR